MSKKKKKTKNPTVIESSKSAEAKSETKYLHSTLLAMITFLSGCLVMVIELTSSRLLAPYYGNTIYCWTGVIGTILFAMSLGYLVGGIIADKNQQKSMLLVWLLAASGLATATIPVVAKLFSSSLATYSSTSGPIMGTFIVFALPAFLLSTMPPLCVKLISENLKLVGLASGLISSTSAVGSIVGTFATGFVLIPAFNLSTIYYLAAVILLLLAAFVFVLQNRLSDKRNLAAVILLPLLWGGWAPYQQVEIFPQQANMLEKKLTPYHLIRVYDNNDHLALKLDTTNEGALSKDGKELVFEYTKYWQLTKCFIRKNDLKQACFIGGGAFAMPIMFHRYYDRSHIDVIEIDPELVAVGKKYFRLGEQSEKFAVHAEDGRRWFGYNDKKYDFIFLDAFHGERNIPPHLVTSEYFAQLRAALSDKGVVALNMIAARSGKKAQLYESITATILQHFPQIYVFSTHTFSSEISSNLILFCLSEKGQLNGLERKAKLLGNDHLYDNLVTVLRSEMLTEKQRQQIFTDEYAPVEYLVAE